jgi:hypothetical protein
VAEWREGSGLQSRAPRFDPGRALHQQPKEAAMFTLGMPVLIDGGQNGWITGTGTMADKGQVVWVDINGRLRLFAGGDLYRLKPATASSTWSTSWGRRQLAGEHRVPVPPTAQGVSPGGTRAGPRQARAAGRTPAPIPSRERRPLGRRGRVDGPRGTGTLALIV